MIQLSLDGLAIGAAGVDLTTKVAATLDPDTAYLTLWSVEGGISEVYSAPPSPDVEGLVAKLVPALQKTQGNRASRTADFWETVTTHCHAAKVPCAILFVTDAYSEDDDAASHARIAAAARVLATSPVTLIGFVGVVPGNREQLRRDLAPVANRIHFYELNEADTFIADLRSGGAQ